MHPRACDADFCAEGDVMVWTNARLDTVRPADPSTGVETTLRATVAADSCGDLVGTEVAFIRLDVDPP